MQRQPVTDPEKRVQERANQGLVLKMPTSMCWCHQCECEVAVTAARDEERLCPQCNSGFVEELGHEGVGEDVGGSSTSGAGLPPFHPPPHLMMRWGARRWMRERRYRQGPPPPAPHMPANPMELHMEMMETMSAFVSGMDGHGSGRIVRVRHGHPSDPMVLVRGLPHGLMDEEGSADVFYDDPHHHHHHHRRSGFGIGRRHHHGHAHIVDYGLDQLIQHLAATGVTTAGFSGSQNDMTRCGPLPAARSAVDAMPTVKISQKHLSIDSHCAVCTDQFEIGGEAREMPCKHIYHADCILPWLAQHNSCPVCRHELPAEEEAYGRGQGENGISPTPEENGGLTIWGLPGGGFAVGRFSTPRGGSSTTNESSSSRNTSVIFRRGFVSDLGIRAENQAQGRRSNPLSFLWPFRSSNTNSESSSSNNGTSRWWFR